MTNPLSKRWGCSSTRLPRAGSLQEVQEFCRSKTKTGELGLFLTGMGGVVAWWWVGGVGVEVQRRAAELGALQNLNMEAGGKKEEKCLQRRAEAAALR